MTTIVNEVDYRPFCSRATYFQPNSPIFEEKAPKTTSNPTSTTSAPSRSTAARCVSPTRKWRALSEAAQGAQWWGQQHVWLRPMEAILLTDTGTSPDCLHSQLHPKERGRGTPLASVIPRRLLPRWPTSHHIHSNAHGRIGGRSYNVS